MSSVKCLRDFVSERLTAAAEEILGVFQKTIVEYEEEIDRQRRVLLDVVWKPDINLQGPELPQQHACKEEEQLCIQERSSSLDQEDPEPPQIKEEQVEVSVTRMNRQEIQDAVLSSLPDLTHEMLTSLLDGLEELGIESKNDLQFLQEKDLEKYIRPVQSRKLVNGWRHEEHSSVDSNSGDVASPPLSLSSSLTPSVPSPSTQSTPELSVTSLPSRPWHTNFRVDWGRMPEGIQRAVISHERPSPNDRRQMVKALVDQMREHDLNPSRAVCHNIVETIIREYPRSFADVDLNGEFVGDGCSSLLMQIKTRVENKNRNNPVARRKRKRSSNSEGGDPTRGPAVRFGNLRPIRCRKLQNGSKHEEHSSVDSHSGDVASPPLSLNSSLTLSVPSPSTQSTLEMSVTALPNRPWHTNFRVDWDKMPVEIQRAVISHERPSPNDRRQMVKALVDQMREHDLNPSRAVCHNIVETIIREYPQSFADVDQNGEFVGDGCSSLLMQIKTRVEYKNRNNPVRRRRKRSCNSEGGDRTRGPEDQYGCVRWKPSDLPSGETEETLEDLRRQMVTLHLEEGMAGAEKAVTLLEKTYTIQRRYLNTTPAPAISDIKREWPFLFSQSGMFSHFLHLTDISIVAKLSEAMERKGDTTLKFCHELNKKRGVEEVLANCEPNTAGDKAVCIILHLLAYFKEARDSIFLQADPSATAVDIQRTLTLPSTPRLILSGEVMKPRAWMLSIEGEVVMGPHANFVNGIAAVFASYYNFNLQYPEEASCTLEFIQRCFVGINPEKGSKAKKHRGGMNPHVCTLMRKLMDLECMST